MPKITLTDEEKIKLLEAVNAGVEPSPDLLPKLFPGTAEKFDVKALDRAKIPTLEYAGKRSKAAILAEAGAGIGAAPLQVVRSFGETKEGEWQNLIVQGDNLQFLKTCYRNEDPLIKDKVKGKVKLIYIDPPFATKSDFGGKEGEKSYADKVATAEFIEGIRERLIYLRELLSEDGTIFVHLDWKMAEYIKVTLDELFSSNNFINEIVWCYTGPSSPGMTGFANKHDTIYWYSKSAQFSWNVDSVRLPYAESTQKNEGKKTGFTTGNPDMVVELNALGKYPEDWWQMSVLPPASMERKMLNYPTQKREKLLQRVILAASNHGDLVLDVFAGSGTTGAVAEKLGRRWILGDFGKHAIYTIQKRMVNIALSKALADNIREESESGYGQAAKPFSVVSAGAYDFSRVMALGNPEHKDTYIAFVLGLFQLGRDEEKAKRFKLANIYADKDGAPVEVYPVWDEHYLKDVRIDEGYLKEIIAQAGGRLHGEYHIITPESCTNIGDTTLKNSEGKSVTFKFLTFPYKVLEDASRHLELHEQPASQGAVNELITSTAFYFNEDVEIDAKREDAGLKLTKFETKILDKAGNRFPEFEGLAMLLVDLDHEAGKPFDMDKTIFSKDIKEDGSFEVGDISGKTIAIIAIDKHGNESKPFVVK